MPYMDPVAPAGSWNCWHYLFCWKISQFQVWKVLFILSWLPLCFSIFDGCIFYKGPKPFSQHMNSKPSSPSWFFIGRFIEFTVSKSYPMIHRFSYLLLYSTITSLGGGEKKHHFSLPICVQTPMVRNPPDRKENKNHMFDGKKSKTPR